MSMSTQDRGDLKREPSSLSEQVVQQKESLRRLASDVGNLATELQSVRSRAVAQEKALKQETSARQAAEVRARELTRRLEDTRKAVEVAQAEAQSSASVAEDSLKELMELAERLEEADELNEVATASARSLHLRCESLLRDLEEKNSELQKQRTLTGDLERQLGQLRDEIKLKESAHKRLRYEIQELESQIESSMGKAYSSKEYEFRELLNEVSARNIENLEKNLSIKDEEIAKLRQDVADAQAVKKLSLELDSQVERQQKMDQELQKKILKLEFCLEAAQKQTKRLRKIAEKKELENQNLRSQIWLQQTHPSRNSKPNFWSNFKLPGLLSVSAIALLCMIRR